jgi:hypothetical protein
MELSLVRVVRAIDCCAVTAKAIGEESGNAPDGSNTDARQVVNLAVGKSLLEICNDLPTVNERLEFGWRAEVLEKTAALPGRFEADYGLEKVIFGTRLLPFGFVAIGFNYCISVLTY